MNRGNSLLKVLPRKGGIQMSDLAEYSKWKSEWTRQIRRDHVAKQALEKLVKEGCAAEDLAQLVFRACSKEISKLPMLHPPKHGRRDLLRSAEHFCRALAKAVTLHPHLR